MKLLAAATILGSIVSVQMYSKGAPATVCTSMIPKHGASPQSNASPYTLTVSKQSYKPKEVIQVVLSGSATFKGFLIMPTKYVTLNTTGLNIPDITPLRSSQSDDQLTDQLSTVGTLTSDSPTTNNCQTTALTHTNNSTKQSVTFTWTAPADNQGPIVFKYTVVQSKSIYWVGMSSEPITYTEDNKNASNQVTYSVIAILVFLLTGFLA